jgi:Flp pilus assembly protein CpaB
MKRNIMPLLGIAVVVAILSTGVFYGLFAGRLHSASADVSGQPIVIAAHDLERGKVLGADDLKVSQFKGALAGSFSNPEQVLGSTLIAAVKQNEPLLEERVVSKNPIPGSAQRGVPSGLRAVSIRISESDGVIALLRPGAKVDLQAVQDRPGGPELRTILQDIEVVSVGAQPQPAAGNRGPVSIVTVLAKPEDADVLAVADAGTRLRLSLRNPLDDQTGPRRAISAGTVFQSAAIETPREFVGYVPAGALQVDIKVLRASVAALNQLESKLEEHGSHPEGSTNVGAFAAGVDAAGLVQQLAGRQEIAILAERHLSASGAHPAWFRAGPAGGQIGLELFPEGRPGGKVNLKIRQEIVSQTAEGAETRRYEAGVPAAGSFLVRGILSGGGGRETLERMFPGNSWADGRLLILISSSEAGELTARHDRGR